jgi:hypothetical protein
MIEYSDASDYFYVWLRDLGDDLGARAGQLGFS